MIPVDQTKLHSKTVNGNCLAASLASILEMSLSEIPEFEEGQDDGNWWPRLLSWLESIGFTLLHWNEEVVLPGYYMVMGTSPRDKSINHQVIYKHGELSHDPHPSKEGIIKIKEVMVLVPLDPAPFKVQQPTQLK